MHQNDTIIALATPSGAGAIAVIRLSGPEAIAMADTFFKSIHEKKLADQKSHTIHLGHITEAGRVLDEVLVSVFKNPRSYTGENVVEISCHGSSYIQQEIIQLFVRNGARIANPGSHVRSHGHVDLRVAVARHSQHRRQACQSRADSRRVRSFCEPVCESRITNPLVAPYPKP